MVAVDHMLLPTAVAGILASERGKTPDLPAYSENMEEGVGNEPLAVE